MYIHTQYTKPYTYTAMSEKTNLDNKGEKVTANSGMITLTDSMLKKFDNSVAITLDQTAPS